MTKQCVKCGSFERTPNGKQCAPCRKEYLKTYRASNKDKIYAVERAWRLANPSNVEKTRKKWNDANSDHLKMYYMLNAEKKRAKTKEWYASNKDRAAAYKREYYKIYPEVRANGKARRRTNIGSDRLPHGTVPALFKSQNGLCACCKQPLTKYHVDHIMPLALGGKNVPSNVQLLLPVCNQRKSAKHPDVWKQEIEAREHPQNPQISDKTS